MSTAQQQKIPTLPGNWNRELDDRVHAILGAAKELNVSYDLLLVENRPIKGPKAIHECESCHAYYRMADMGAGYRGLWVCKTCVTEMERPFEEKPNG
jgi:hypothetical protein